MNHFNFLNLFLAILLVVGITFTPCYTEDIANWEEHWVQAVEYCEAEDYTAAEAQFALSIQALESSKDLEHPHVYVDRARLLCLLDRQAEALKDLNIALASIKLTGNDLIKALLTRAHVYVKLGKEDEAMSDHNRFRSLYQDFPTAEFTKDRIIIRNVPDCECYRSTITKVLLMSEMCASEADIQWLKSGICIAKRQECHCESDKQPCSPDLPTSLSTRSECDYWCDKANTASVFFCYQTFKTWRCQAVCCAVVELMTDACHWCCENGNFYKRCLECFDNLLQRIGEGCDPAFN